jgi:hypothetical protein
MTSRTNPRAATAARAVEKCRGMSLQLAHSKAVVISPPTGSPQRWQYGGTTHRTCCQHCAPRNPSAAVARSVPQI